MSMRAEEFVADILHLLRSHKKNGPTMRLGKGKKLKRYELMRQLLLQSPILSMNYLNNSVLFMGLG